MNWLMPMVVLLGLAALLGVLWLHLGHGASAGTAEDRNRNRVIGNFQPRDERAELAVTIAFLRRRAVYYRELAETVPDVVRGARYWDVAALLDRAANALEQP